jgi:ribosome-associated translation inhibitor RaiA
MLIQVNTDGNVAAHEEFRAQISANVTKTLGHLGERVTRVEVHLGDEDGAKRSANDRRCMMEARIEGRQPIAVTAHASSLDEAVDDAAEKLRDAIEHALGKFEERHASRESMRTRQ